MEKIKEIKELDTLDKKDYMGYQIVTDKQTIELGITSDSNCCEHYGYFYTNGEDLQSFVGSTLNSITIVDSALNTTKLDAQMVNFLTDNEELSTMFVNFDTSIGTLQLAVYNSHNGYYGHRVYLKSNQVNETGFL